MGGSGGHQAGRLPHAGRMARPEESARYVRNTVFLISGLAASAAVRRRPPARPPVAAATPTMPRLAAIKCASYGTVRRGTDGPGRR